MSNKSASSRLEMSRINLPNALDVISDLPPKRNIYVEI